MDNVLTCIHSDHGLCPDCQAEYDEDALAWAEFGNHTAGLARLRALQAEMEAARLEELSEPFGQAFPDDEPLPF